MKTPRLLLVLLAATFALSLPSPGIASAEKKSYSARLISPKAGEVLRPGQVVRIEWTSDFPNVDLSMCETEVLLSLDGGKTTYWRLTELRNPRRVQYFDWTVPNTPTNSAVLEIRFGCLNLYPETSSLQLQSTFVIAPSVN